MLSEENKTILKNALEQERAVLEIELSDIGKLNPTNPSDWQGTTGKFESGTADTSVLADRFEEESTNEAVVSELEVRYKNVKTALTRMENNTYGICSVGNEQIPFERLEANPSATTCIEHADAD